VIDLFSLINDVLNEVSGKRAWDWVSRISLHHRIQGSPGFSDAAKQILTELKSYQLNEVNIHKYPCDGESKSWEWTPSYSWKIKSAELNLVEPKKELLANFDELPTSVVTHSQSANVIAEVIDIATGDKPEDFEGKDLQGKIVLMSGSTRGKTPNLLHDAGVAGVLIYPPADRAAGYPSMVRYDGFWPDMETREKIPFGFSLSYAQALELKKLLKEGPVKVHAQVDAELYNGELEVLSAAITGTEFPEEEVLLMAHLCHPAASANDNASGSAGLLELARSLSSLIQKEVIESPKRTIRFIWMPEFMGTVPYALEYETRWKKAVACINLDMIGEDPVQIGYPFQVSSAPYSTPSIFNDIIYYFTKRIADHPKGVAIGGTPMPQRYRFGPFEGGSDHLISADSHFGIPSVMFGHGDMFHHTSLDTINVCDPTEMQRVIGIALCTSYMMAQLDDEKLLTLWGIIQKGVYERLGKTSALLNDVLIENNSDNDPAGFGMTIINASVNHEKAIINSRTKINSQTNPMTNALLSNLESWEVSMKAMWEQLCQPSTKQKASYLTAKYARNFDGPLSYSKVSSIREEEVYKNFANLTKESYGGSFYELINLVGLSYDVQTIGGLLSLQYGILYYPNLIFELLELLKEKELLKEFQK
jgi:hypothetical protein